MVIEVVTVVLTGDMMTLTTVLTCSSTRGGGGSSLEASAVAIAVTPIAVESAGSINFGGLASGTAMAAVANTVFEASIVGCLANNTRSLPFALGGTTHAGRRGPARITFLAEARGDNTITTEEGMGLAARSSDGFGDGNGGSASSSVGVGHGLALASRGGRAGGRAG